MVTSVNGVSTASSATSSAQNTGFAALGQREFFQLMTTQMKLQDPFDPVDNKEMLAQMAQFSALAGVSETNQSLASISEKLDALIAQQSAAASPDTAA